MPKSRPPWAPASVDITRPSPARTYDALLGGSHNFGADRQAAAWASALVPDLPRVALSNRAFLGKAVRFMAAKGITQFLDIGSGIPALGSVHEIAQAANPACTVVYVDIDSVAVTQAAAIVSGNPRVAVVQADCRHPARTITQVKATGFLDFSRPVGLLLVAVLHLIADADDPAGIVRVLQEAIPDGSYVAISHLTTALRPDAAATIEKHAAKDANFGLYFRSRNDITALFGGLRPVEPGITELPLWRPEPGQDEHEQAGRSLGLAGIGLIAR